MAKFCFLSSPVDSVFSALERNSFLTLGNTGGEHENMANALKKKYALSLLVRKINASQ